MRLCPHNISVVRRIVVSLDIITVGNIHNNTWNRILCIMSFILNNGIDWKIVYRFTFWCHLDNHGIANKWLSLQSRLVRGFCNRWRTFAMNVYIPLSWMIRPLPSIIKICITFPLRCACIGNTIHK